MGWIVQAVSALRNRGQLEERTVPEVSQGLDGPVLPHPPLRPIHKAHLQHQPHVMSVHVSAYNSQSVYIHMHLPEPLSKAPKEGGLPAPCATVDMESAYHGQHESWP